MGPVRAVEVQPTTDSAALLQKGDMVIVRIKGEEPHLARIIACPSPHIARLRSVGDASYLVECKPFYMNLLAYESEMEALPSTAAGELMWSLLED